MVKWRLALIFSLFFNANASAVMNVATIDWCPFICPMSLSKPGLLVEYTKEVFIDAPIEINFEVYPWSRAIKLANEGKVDALLAPAKNEAPRLLFPDVEIGIQRFCFFSRQNDPWQYHNPESINKRTIIHPRDTLPTPLHQANLSADFITYPYNDNFLPTSTDILLKTDRVDTVMMTYYSMLHFLNSKQLTGKVRLSGCVSRQKLYLAFTPNKASRPKIEILMGYYHKNITKLKKKHYFSKLLKKYNIKQYPTENDWK